MPVLIGTSGWQYRDWRGAFYPEKLPQRAWLDHYTAAFATVEVNNTFYSLPKREVFAAWAERLPRDFVMTLKLSRYLSHVRRLREPEEPVRRFLERAGPLVQSGRAGPLLLQLPPRMTADVERLRATLAAIPRERLVALEVRDRSWLADEVLDVLHAHDVPLVLTDRGGELLEREVRTASWGYIRLHEGGGRWPCYTEGELRRWTARIATLFGPRRRVAVYFNNDPRCCAIADAIRFAALCREAGLHPTRTPGAGAVRVVGG